MADGLAAARRGLAKVQGRRSGRPLSHPLEVPAGDWALTLRTTWVEPAYLEPDASWCRPSGVPENVGNNSVTVYPPGSDGNVEPSVIISGVKSGLDDPIGLAFDSSGNIYVGNNGNDSITVYPPNSKNWEPIATIDSSTGLNGAGSIAFDSIGHLYVGNGGGDTTYALGSHGQVTQIANINGSNTGFIYPWGFTLDSTGNIYVLNNTFVSMNTGQIQGADSVMAFAAGSNGNVAPFAIISGIKTGLVAPSGIAIGR